MSVANKKSILMQVKAQTSMSGLQAEAGSSQLFEEAPLRDLSFEPGD